MKGNQMSGNQRLKTGRSDENRNILSESDNGDPIPLQDLPVSLPQKSKASPPPSALPLEKQLSSLAEEETNSSSTAESKMRHRCRDVSTLLSFLVASVFTNASLSLIDPFFPNEAEKKGATPVAVGGIIGAAPLWMAVLSPVMGILFHLIGARLAVFLGLLLVGTSYILLAFVTFIPITWLFILVTFLLRTVEGIGLAMFATAKLTLVPALFPKSVGTVIGLVNMAVGVGYSLGYPLGGVLYELGGFQLPFIAVGVPTLAMIIPCVLLLKKNDIKKKKKPLPVKTMWKILFDGIFIAIFIDLILSAAGLAFFQPTLEPFLLTNFNMTPVLVALTSFIKALTLFLVSLPLGLISDKVGHHRYFSITGMFLIVLGCIIVSIPNFTGIPQYWYIAVAFVLIGAGSALGLVTTYPEMIKLAGKSARNEVDQEIFIPFISGMVSSGLSLGEFLGPVLSGGLRQFLTFSLAALVFAEIALAQAITLLAMSLVNYYT